MYNDKRIRRNQKKHTHSLLKCADLVQCAWENKSTRKTRLLTVILGARAVRTRQPMNSTNLTFSHLHLLAIDCAPQWYTLKALHKTIRHSIQHQFLMLFYFTAAIYLFAVCTWAVARSSLGSGFFSLIQFRIDFTHTTIYQAITCLFLFIYLLFWLRRRRRFPLRFLSVFFETCVIHMWVCVWVSAGVRLRLPISVLNYKWHSTT